MPTSYVAAGAYVFPTSYAVPTVYATAYLTESAPVTPTTYLAPSYYETRFRRRGLFGRRLVETSRALYSDYAYYPTTYYYPTTFRSSAIVDAAVMPTLYARTTSTRCCGEVVDTPIVRDLPASSEPARSTVAASPAARSEPPVERARLGRRARRSFPDASSRLSGQLLPHRPRPSRPHRGRASPTWTPCRIPPRSSSRRPDLARPPPRPPHLVPRYRDRSLPQRVRNFSRPPIKRLLARVASGETRKGPC